MKKPKDTLNDLKKIFKTPYAYEVIIKTHKPTKHEVTKILDSKQNLIYDSNSEDDKFYIDFSDKKYKTKILVKIHDLTKEPFDKINFHINEK
ncbi:MAG: hypothetical protein ACOCRK_02995 [bacterium]